VRQFRIFNEFDGWAEIFIHNVEPSVNLANKRADFVLICEDGYQFADNYSKDGLHGYLKEAKSSEI